MIETKIFEIVDRGTCLPAIAVKVTNSCGICGEESDRHCWLMDLAGWHMNSGIYLFHAGAPGRVSYDPYSWGQSRTFHVAHLHIEKHWNDLKDGACIDVCELLGEPPHGTDYKE
jgi:hypothetical protein